MDIDNLPIDGVETRSVPFSDLEVTKNGRHFEGYASVYGQEADLGDFVEVVLPPAIDVGLRNSPNLPMVWDHNMGLPPFATTGAGTLKVTTDRRGMKVSTEIDERHILGPTMMSMAERGELSGMSIGFITGRKDNKISHRNDGRILRSIVGFKQLLDVSPTWNPAYSGTSAELRSLTTMGASVLVPEQLHDGESQSAVDGPEDQETTDAGPDEQQAADSPEGICEHGEGCTLPECQAVEAGEQEPEEQRSGVDANASAARKRRLQMMGLSLPR